MILLSEVCEYSFFKSVLKRIDEITLANMLKGCKRKQFSSKHNIFRQGDLANCAYLVEEGEVLFTIELQKGGQGHSTVKRQMARCRENQMFGEFSLHLMQGKRTATATTVVYTKLIQIPKGEYLAMCSTVQKNQLEELSIPYIDMLSSNQRFKLCKQAEKKYYSYQHQVFRMGEEAQQMYFITSGEFKKVGREGIITYLQPGCLFGQEDLIRGKLRSYTVTCNSAEASVYSFPKPILEEVLLRNQYILREFNKKHEFLNIQYSSRSKNRTHIYEKYMGARTGRMQEKKKRLVTLPQFQEHSCFSKLLRERQYFMESPERMRNRKKKQLDLPKPWFSSSNKKLKASLTRLLSKNVVEKTKPKLKERSQFWLFSRRIMTQLNYNPSKERSYAYD